MEWRTQAKYTPQLFTHSHTHTQNIHRSYIYTVTCMNMYIDTATATRQEDVQKMRSTQPKRRFFVCQIHAHTHARISFTLYSLSPCRCLYIVTYYEWNAPIHTQANKYIAHTLEAHSIIFSKKKFSVFFSLYNLSVLFFFPFSWTGPFSFFRQIKLSSNFLNRQLERNEFQKEFVSTNQSYRDLFLVFFLGCKNVRALPSNFSIELSPSLVRCKYRIITLLWAEFSNAKIRLCGALTDFSFQCISVCRCA